jgi:cytochrome c
LEGTTHERSGAWIFACCFTCRGPRSGACYSRRHQGRSGRHGEEGRSAIKTEGADKAYAEICDPRGPFVDGDLYIVVYRMDGLVVAHGADKNRIGTNLLHDNDVDGKEFVKERIDLAKTASSFWQSYKFMNPVSKTIEPKEMYCERLNDTVVCGGVYRS